MTDIRHVRGGALGGRRAAAERQRKKFAAAPLHPNEQQELVVRARQNVMDDLTLLRDSADSRSKAEMTHKRIAFLAARERDFLTVLLEKLEAM